MFDIKKFKETAMPMWKQKYKANFDCGVTSTDNTISLNDCDGYMVEFTPEYLRIREDGALEAQDDEINHIDIPYGEDELEFIKAVQKAAKKIGNYTLKNLKALRDNIKLRDFDAMLEHQPLFRKYDMLMQKIGRYSSNRGEQMDQLLGISSLKNNIKSMIGKEVYVYDWSNEVRARIPIEKMTIKSLHQLNDVVIEDTNGKRWSPRACFLNEREAQISWLTWNFVSNAWSYMYDHEYGGTTKADKVKYYDNINMYLKYVEKFPEQMSYIENELITKRPEYYL